MYRLLIEIRRIDGGNGNGYTDGILDKTLEEEDLEKRNRCRSLTIFASDKISGNSFNSNGYIKFSPSDDKRETCVFGNEKNGEVEIIRASRPDDVGLFHELLHWFHTLRDFKRKNEETQIYTETDDLNLLTAQNSMDSENIESWMIRENSKNPMPKIIIKMEEFRTIMGYTVSFLVDINGKIISYTPKNILNGDDLSENLYRLCIGQSLRYGHSIDETTILDKVAKRALEFCNNAINAGGYKIN